MAKVGPSLGSGRHMSRVGGKGNGNGDENAAGGDERDSVGNAREQMLPQFSELFHHAVSYGTRAGNKRATLICRPPFTFESLEQNLERELQLSRKVLLSRADRPISGKRAGLACRNPRDRHSGVLGILRVRT